MLLYIMCLTRRDEHGPYGTAPWKPKVKKDDEDRGLLDQSYTYIYIYIYIYLHIYIYINCYYYIYYICIIILYYNVL